MATNVTFSYDPDSDPEIAQALAKCGNREKSAFIRQMIKAGIEASKSNGVKPDSLDSDPKLDKILALLEEVKGKLENGVILAGGPEEEPGEEDHLLDIMGQMEEF